MKTLVRQRDGYYRYEPKRQGTSFSYWWGMEGLSALEAARVMHGFSAEVGGIISATPYCPPCMRFLFHGHDVVRLFKPERLDGRVMKGELFECGSCGGEFIAHRDENPQYEEHPQDPRKLNR